MQIKSKLYNEVEDDICYKKEKMGKRVRRIGEVFGRHRGGKRRGHLQGEVRWLMWVLLRRWNLSKQLKDVS